GRRARGLPKANGEAIVFWKRRAAKRMGFCGSSCSMMMHKYRAESSFGRVLTAGQRGSRKEAGTNWLPVYIALPKIHGDGPFPTRAALFLQSALTAGAG